MFQAKLEVSERTDLERFIVDVRVRAGRTGMPPDRVDELARIVSDSVGPLLVRGRELAELGSQMQVDRKIEGEDHRLVIACRFGVKERAGSRLLRWLRRS